MSTWVRKWSVPVIVGGWALSIGFALVLRAWIGSSFVESIAANFIADMTVALLAFVLANVLFGLRQRHSERVEARRKALQIVAFELAENVVELRRLVDAVAGGGASCKKALSEKMPTFSRESWNLLLQSPLVAHLPDDIVWSVEESHWMNTRIGSKVERNLRRTLARSPEAWDSLAAELHPEFETALRLAEEATEKVRGMAG